MLNVDRKPVGYAPVLSQLAAGEAQVREVLRILRRRMWLIVASTVVFATLGALYVAVAPRLYSATATLLVASPRVQVNTENLINAMPTETFLESQVQILQSEAIAHRVATKLKLSEDPEFNGTKPRRSVALINGVLDSVSGWLPRSLSLSRFKIATDAPQPVEPGSGGIERAITMRLLGNLKVNRSVRTYLIGLTYTSPDPEKAAKIADAFAEAYLVDQLEIQYEQTRRAAEWLSERLEEMRLKVEYSERQVEAFRSQSGLTDADGRLIADQQLRELDSQLTLVRTRLAELAAKLFQINEIREKGGDPSAMPDIVASESMLRLKTQYQDLVRNLNDLTNRYGAQHPQVVSAQQQVKAARALIDNEVLRIGESIRNDFEVAKSRETSLRQSFQEMTEKTAALRQSQVRLRELEREASSNRTVYERFLNRYKEINANENVPTTDARVLAAASVPTGPSEPKSFVIMALATAIGGMLGLVGAFAIEHLHAGVRSRRDVEEKLGFPLLAQVPRVRGRQAALSSYAVDYPLSGFAEAIRSIRMGIRHAQGYSQENKVVLLTSALPGEGKSTTSLNVARNAAHSGSKVLLIDADLRRPTLTKLLSPDTPVGLAQVLAGEIGMDAALIPDPLTGLSFLPTSRQARIVHSAELLSSPAMAKLIEDARNSYDLVIIDASPLLPVVDTRAILGVTDKVVLVVEWNRTSRYAIGEALDIIGAWKDQIIGIVLNKLDTKRAHYYGEYNMKAYASRHPEYYGGKNG
ncbi:polysaccharide biosynthesis tyrosine autokinase [Alsobacter sp. R-9]